MIEKAPLFHPGCWEAGVTATGPASLKADIPASSDGRRFSSAGDPQLPAPQGSKLCLSVLLRMVWCVHHTPGARRC